MNPGTHSSFATDDWLPVQEELLRGLNHALSNRMASLAAVLMLLDAGRGSDEGGSADARLREVLDADVEKMQGLLVLYRTLPSGREGRREAGTFSDAMRLAAQLLEHHQETRDLTLMAPESGAGVEPVTLWGCDALRAAVLLQLAIARDAPGAPVVRVTLGGESGWVEVRVSRDGAAESQVRACPEYAMLARFAASEGGRMEIAPGDDGATLTLVLPGMTRGRATAQR